MANHTKVSIEERLLKSGRISMRLVYYPRFYDILRRKTVRTESLNIYKFSNPKTAEEKHHNAWANETATTVMCKRIQMIRNQEFDFLNNVILDRDFLEYFRDEIKRRGNNTKWQGCYSQLYKFCGGQCRFKELTIVFCRHFHDYLLNEAKSRRTGEPLSKNSASGYLLVFRTLIKQLYSDGIIPKNLNDHFDGIPTQRVRKDFLTMDEVKRLVATPCKFDVLKRISIFAIFSALRISDLRTLTWDQIIKAPDGGWCIRKKIIKTRQFEEIFISDEALSWCGPRDEGIVFKGFKKSMLQSPFKNWLKNAGITKHFTFHGFRHTAATQMLAHGVDIMEVKEALTHSNIQTTMVYAALVDEKKRSAANAITLLK